MADEIPARLYHGTARRHLEAILARGLVPRAELATEGNWEHTVTSNPRSVYLTDAYPLHFAFAASDADNDEDGLVIEVDTTRLDAKLWRPDEDFLAQGLRGKDDLPNDWDMTQRAGHYRERAHEYVATPSLTHLGTIAYAGTVPAGAVTRVALIEAQKMRWLILWGFDPVIALMNYKFLGDFYRRGTQWLFGANPEPDQGMDGPRPWPARDGIRITTADELRAKAA